LKPGLRLIWGVWFSALMILVLEANALGNNLLLLRLAIIYYSVSCTLIWIFSTKKSALNFGSLRASLLLSIARTQFLAGIFSLGLLAEGNSTTPIMFIFFPFIYFGILFFGIAIGVLWHFLKNKIIYGASKDGS
jgi:hypothetical protein